MPVAQSLEQRFADAIAGFRDFDHAVVLAVSGGSDSTALMYLASRVMPRSALVAVSVNHGLRAEAEQEIMQVSGQASALGIEHVTANWQWSGLGNLQSAARDGRWDCLRRIAVEKGVGWVWTGHTEDDQVETALMRLARGSGVDGLAGMTSQSTRDSLKIGRPLLGLQREELRHWLVEKGIGWSDDPSNDDPGFDRVRVRQLLPQLEALGLTRKRLLQTVEHMQAAKVTLEKAAASFAGLHVRQEAGDLLLSSEVLDLDGGDTPRRVFASALGWISGRSYRPRFAQLLDAASEAKSGTTLTLGGVLVSPEADGRVRLTREQAATSELILTADATSVLWDTRWRIEGQFRSDMTVRALGDAIRDCPQWRDVGLLRHTLMASPSVWQSGRLIAAPVAGLGKGWSARIVADFHSEAFPIED